VQARAVEKQIPKKPIEEEKQYSEDYGFNSDILCPVCNNYIGYYTEAMCKPEYMQYCNECGQRMKKTYQEAVEWTAKRIEPFDRAYLDIVWYEPNRRRDLDNIAAGKKFILDGLQAIGKIENDGWKQIAGFTDTFEVDKQDPRVEVKIRRL
jgi:Holliday junction resolvase RusA-like endonuclease